MNNWFVRSSVFKISNQNQDHQFTDQRKKEKSLVGAFQL